MVLIMLMLFARQILDMSRSIELYLGAGNNPMDWDDQGMSSDSSDAWNEEIGRPAEGTNVFQNWMLYLDRLRDIESDDYSGYVLVDESSPPRWFLIQDPKIEELILPKPNWKVPMKLIREEWDEGTSPEGQKCDDVLWRMSNACKSANHGVSVKTVPGKSLYIPSGLHVFKPLAPDLFVDACKELYQLYMDEDLKPSPFFSPDRTQSLVMARKTMLIYTIKRTEYRDGFEYLYPQHTIPDTLNVLRVRGYTKLAEFAEKHVHALIRLTSSSYEDVKTTGGIIFLRYAPGEGFRPHIDGTAGLGHSPGPILNVTMGIEGEKVFDMMPSACWMDEGKKPLRITTKPGEGILLWNESRVAWTHCIPEGDCTWRYTMGIKLKLNDRESGIESRGTVADYGYKNYELDLSNVLKVSDLDTRFDAVIPDDLVPISRCVRFDDSSGWRYELPPGIKEVVNNQQTRPRSGRGGGVPTASGRSWPRRR